MNPGIVRYRYLWLLLFAGFAMEAMADSSMRCGTQLVSIGDSKAEVLLTCGEPFLTETIGIKEYTRQINVRNFKRGFKFDQGNLSVQDSATLAESVDKWTYHMGKGKFLRYLIFQAGELVDISTGDRI